MQRWRAEGGYRDVFSVAVPLILSTATWSLQNFIDRVFLSWWSQEAVAASLPAGMLNFSLVSFFLGTAGYVSTFVAQYFGSEQKKMIGPVLWQGLYIALAGGIALLPFIPLADMIFNFIGHSAEVRQAEVVYFRILCLGALPLVASSAMSGFFSGLGRTGVVLASNLAATAENIIADYILIFGTPLTPAMGIEGAAVATAISPVVSCLVYGAVIFRGESAREFNTRRGWKFNPSLFRRLIRFGLPNGVQFFLEVMGFTLFVLFVGRLGTVKLAATNIAFNISSIAFMPMIGLGITVSVLVGQYLGMNRADRAEYSVYSGLHITMVYMGFISFLYVAFPELFIAFYAARSHSETFPHVASLVKVLLRFVAIYNLFDAMNIIFAGAIKGAGDTRFVMIALFVMSLCGLVVPTYVAIVVLGMDIYAAWTVATLFVASMGILFCVRFMGGAWKKMRVIEEPRAAIPASMPESIAGKVEV